MAMHKVFRRTSHSRPLPNKTARQIAATSGRVLVDLRFQHKLSRTEAGRAIGAEWHRMRLLEEGLRAPSLDELVELAALYRVDVGELFWAALKGSDTPVPAPPPKKKKCLCERLGPDGRAALRKVVAALRA